VTVAELLGKILAPDSPWILVLAVALLVAAAGIGRRLFASLQRIGARVGALERLTESEQTRRRQVEAELLECGVPLPLWPADPASVRELAVLRRRVAGLSRPARGDGYDDEDQAAAHDAYPLTTERPAPPPPVRTAAAAHRR
jgi:hypothetical protein